MEKDVLHNFKEMKDCLNRFTVCPLCKEMHEVNSDSESSDSSNNEDSKKRELRRRKKALKIEKKIIKKKKLKFEKKIKKKLEDSDNGDDEKRPIDRER